MHLCQGCVLVQLDILTVYTETPSHGCKALAFFAPYSSAQPRWWHWLSGDPQVLGVRRAGEEEGVGAAGKGKAEHME